MTPYVGLVSDLNTFPVFDNTQSGACLANELLVHIGSTCFRRRINSRLSD